MSRYLATLGKMPMYGMDLPAHRAQVMLMPRVFEVYEEEVYHEGH